jgi:dCMP deaminase
VVGVNIDRIVTPWNEKYLQQALLVSTWSKDPTTKVGCVISDENNLPLGQGFNGFPKGVLDDPGVLLNKERKRLRTIHAELNAIFFSRGSLEGSTFHITHRPCATCAGAIIQHRAAKVICLEDVNGSNGSNELGEFWKASIDEGRAMIVEAGIEYLAIPRSYISIQ